MAAPDFFLFVSHVAEDRKAALEIVAELERRGVPCWIAPRDVRAGSRFDDEISDALDGCRAMLLIFSERCNESEYIRREVTVAGESHKIIIPFRIQDVQPRRGLRVRLFDLHWIDGFVSRERAIDQVVRDFDPNAARHQQQAQERQSADQRRWTQEEAKTQRVAEARTGEGAFPRVRRLLCRRPVAIGIGIAVAVLVTILGLTLRKTTEWTCYHQGNPVFTVEIWWGHREADAEWVCNQWSPTCRNGTGCTAVQNK